MGTRSLAVVEKWVKATVSDPVGHRTAEWPEQSWWQVRVSCQEAYLAQAPGLLRAPFQGQSQANAERTRVLASSPPALLNCPPGTEGPVGGWPRAPCMTIALRKKYLV